MGPTSAPRRPGSHGQATAEYLGAIAAIALGALAVGAILAASGTGAAVVHALVAAVGGPADAAPRPRRFEQTTAVTQALVLAALESGSGFELRDARLLLAEELGADAGRRELERVAYDRLRSRAESANEHYLMEVRPDGRGTVHVVTAGEERQARAELARRARESARAALALDLTLAAVSALVPETWPAIATAAGASAAAAGEPGRRLPPGTREGDAVLCVPTLITDREHAVGIDELRARRGDPSLRSEPNGQTTFAIVLVVVRAGRVEWWERHDAPRCE
jgi:hypothetical protein